MELTVKIRAAHEASDGVNGAPRILADLRADGQIVTRNTIAGIMRDNGIQGISPASWHPVTTIADESAHTIPGLLNRDFDCGELDGVWTSDITYLSTGEGWLYLCAVRDGCSRRVLGWAIGDHLRTDLVETALRRAVSLRGRDVTGVILHADRGCQGGFNWSSQHLDDGGVEWFVVNRPQIGQSGRNCVPRGIRSISAMSRWRSGGRSPRACLPKKPRALSAWRRRSVRGGSTTLAACHRSI